MALHRMNPSRSAYRTSRRRARSTATSTSPRPSRARSPPPTAANSCASSHSPTRRARRDEHRRGRSGRHRSRRVAARHDSMSPSSAATAGSPRPIPAPASASASRSRRRSSRSAPRRRRTTAPVASTAQGRAPRLLPDDAPRAARPRKLGHVVVGSTDVEASNRFFIEGIGFKVSDEVKGVAHFMRCSQDHHNLLVQKAPVQFLHHTSWQVEDVDEIGLGAHALLSKDPSRHVWGFGRHHVGSNFFWYFRDPAGNFSRVLQRHGRHHR